MTAPLKHAPPDLLGQRDTVPTWFSMMKAGNGLLGDAWLPQPAEDADADSPDEPPADEDTEC